MNHKYTFKAPITVTSIDGLPLGKSQRMCNAINKQIPVELDYLEDDLATYMDLDSVLYGVVESISLEAFYDNGDMYSITTCIATRMLKSEEIDELIDFISGQYSDGWGEGFEQRELPLGRARFYASFWDDDDWEMKFFEYTPLINSQTV